MYFDTRPRNREKGRERAWRRRNSEIPTERRADEAQLQPLAEAAASKDRLEGAVAARATLA